MITGSASGAVSVDITTYW